MNSDHSVPIIPVVLSGGIGSRLWPASRRSRPKQLLALVGEQSMIAETLHRAAHVGDGSTPIVVTNEAHADLISADLDTAGITARMLLEPVGRNTAPAVAAAALVASSDGTDPLLLVLPSDHIIGDIDAFAAAVRSGASAAAGGALVTFGITPSSPETGYGYIKAGESIAPGVLAADEFREKPDAATAERYLESGHYLWNSGMFLFKASSYLSQLEAFDSTTADAVRDAVDRSIRGENGLTLEPEAFGAIKGDSVDYAVMEKTDHAAVVPCDIGWSDVGSWASLWEASAKDDTGNVTHGDVMTQDVSDSYIRSERRLVAVVGVDDVVVVETADAVLVVSRDAAQSVKHIVDRLEANNRPELDTDREDSS